MRHNLRITNKIQQLLYTLLKHHFDSSSPFLRDFEMILDGTNDKPAVTSLNVLINPSATKRQPQSFVNLHRTIGAVWIDAVSLILSEN